jgi:hypothetical protein
MIGLSELHFTIHYNTHSTVLSVTVSNSRCLLAAFNGGRSPSSGFPNCPCASATSFSQRLNLSNMQLCKNQNSQRLEQSPLSRSHLMWFWLTILTTYIKFVMLRDQRTKFAFASFYYSCSCNCICCCICIVFIVCSVSFLVGVVLCAGFRLSVVCYFVLCLTVVPLPLGKFPFAVKINNNNNKI